MNDVHTNEYFHGVDFNDENAEPEPEDTLDLAERWALKLRAFKRPPSLSLMEAARRGIRWAVRRVAALAGPATSAAGAALTEADKRFLTWLAHAAIAFHFSEEQEG